MSVGDFDADTLENIPAASSVGVFFCPGGGCMQPHIMLYDEDGEPFAHFVVPELEPNGTGFLADLTDALMRSASAKTN